MTEGVCSRPGKFDAISMYKCVHILAVGSGLTVESVVTSDSVPMLAGGGQCLIHSQKSTRITSRTITKPFFFKKKKSFPPSL